MSIKEWPEGERPREKLLERGAAALSDAELLAILLRVGTRGMSAVDLARYLLSEFGSLGKLMSADAKTLSACKGMGLASYTQFAVVKEIGRRILGEDLQEQMVLSNPKSVADYLRYGNCRAVRWRKIRFIFVKLSNWHWMNTPTV